MNIAQLFWQAKPLFGSRPVLIFGDREIGHEELAESIRRFTGVLRSRGIGRDSHVLLAMNNCTEWIVAALAVLGTGAICVPVNPGLRPREMANIAAHCNPKLMIVDADLADRFADVPVDVERIERGGTADNDFHRLLLAAQPDPFVAEVEEGDPALIYYTSGTTGLPKGVLLNHGGEVFAITMLSKHIDVNTSDVSIIMGSLAFIYQFIINSLTAIHGGASIVLTDHFHPKPVAEIIERRRVSIIMGVPTMYIMLMNYADQNPTDFSSVRVAFSGGATLGEALCGRARASLGFELFDIWGMTECTPLTTFDPKRDTRGEADSCGRALPQCAFKVVDDNLNEVPAGTVGEILLTGPMIMTGYYRNPTATAETIIDGWVRSGDLGSTDTNGLLYIVGRKKDLIIRGGANIYPADVEEALYTHASVAECAVIGKVHPVYGETVKAYVVKKADDVTADELIAHCRSVLADYKVPSEIEFLKELPKGATGKILRRELREMSDA